MKRGGSAALLLALLFLLCGCAGSRPDPTPDKPDGERPSAEELVEEATPRLWYANCEEYINLRVFPDTAADSIARIPKGAEFTLLDWQERFARVEYEDREGYVLASYIEPSTAEDRAAGLSVVLPAACYSYDQMCADLRTLTQRYLEKVRLDSIGVSGEGRDIPVLLLGDPDSERHVLLQGAIHAREHMTAWLLCALAEYWVAHDAAELEGVCFHIIPMVNPDGVTISQTGALTPAA